MDAVCGELLTSSDVDASVYETVRGREYATKSVSYAGLSVEQLKKMVTIFVYANPQYYFVQANMLYDMSDQTCELMVHDIFAEGDDRETETAKD